MNYQNPHLLYALFAIAIPILIHLYNFRKHQTVYFSSIRFLKEIKEEYKKKSELKNILILLSRILAISFLVISFAKPYTPSNTTKISDNIFLYIDNSQSMDIDFGEGNLLNIAKNKAIEITEAYESEKNFYLITNDFESKNTSIYTSDLIKLQIEKIKHSPRQRSISDIISRISSINSNNSHLYFISDFQENTLKIDDLKVYEINNNISLIPIANRNSSNICIDSLYISTPIFGADNEVEINLLISNTSNENINDEILYLYLDKKQKSQQYVSLLAEEIKEVVFRFLAPANPFIDGEIRTHDSPITFDNNLFFTLSKSEKIYVTIINKENENIAFNALYGNDTSLFNLTSLTLENINYNKLSKQDFIILNEATELSSGLLSALQSFTNNGGSLLVIPPADIVSFNTYNILLKSLKINTLKRKEDGKLKINQFSTRHSIYKNVFTKKLEKINYPISNQAYIINNKKISTQIIGFANKQDFLSAYTSENGNIYQFSSPLDNRYNNFTKHALFVPTLINMATSSNIVKTPYYIIGSNKKIRMKYSQKKTDIIHIKDKNIDIIPTLSNENGKQVLDPHHQITKSGIYSIFASNQLLDKIAFNYNNSESRVLSLTNDEIKGFISKNNIKNMTVIKTKNISLKTLIKEKEIGKEYWQISILLSLIFFAFEIMLIKLIKL